MRLAQGTKRAWAFLCWVLTPEKLPGELDSATQRAALARADSSDTVSAARTDVRGSRSNRCGFFRWLFAPDNLGNVVVLSDGAPQRRSGYLASLLAPQELSAGADQYRRRPGTYRGREFCSWLWEPESCPVEDSSSEIEERRPGYVASVLACQELIVTPAQCKESEGTSPRRTLGRWLFESQSCPREGAPEPWKT